MLPNLDGLYGGKACTRADGAKLTKYGGGEDYKDGDYDDYGDAEDKKRRKRSTEDDDDDYKDGEEGEEDGGKHYGTDDDGVQLKACDLPVCLFEPPIDETGEYKNIPENIQPPCIAVWTGNTSKHIQNGANHQIGFSRNFICLL